MSVNKPLIQPLFDEWWRKGSIVAASEQHRKDIEQAFYCGVLVAMGLIARANKCTEQLAKEMVHSMNDECHAKLKPMQLGPKVTATINGERI